eukprot:scaffold25371_cov39-Phaeocystis_antarctica.AAC.1
MHHSDPDPDPDPNPNPNPNPYPNPNPNPHQVARTTPRVSLQQSRHLISAWLLLSNPSPSPNHDLSVAPTL